MIKKGEQRLGGGEVQDSRIGGRVELPFKEAFQISLEQIQRRVKRSTITIASIALSMALLAHFVLTNQIFGAYGEQTGVRVEAYQFWLLVVSFLVCVVGLTNSTLISVYERYREIGTMKSLGALDRHILKLFLIEYIIYGLAGGLLGFIGGIISATISSSFQIGPGILWLSALDLLLYLVLSVGLSVVLSMIAALYPALKAARLEPVEALEYEL